MPDRDPTTNSRSARGPTGAIRRAYLAMYRCGDVILRPRRITMDQFSLLWAVARSDGIRQSDLAVELFADPNTVTAMLARLEKRKLVKREVSSRDARVRLVRLTPAGRRLTKQLSGDWEPMRQKLRQVFAGEAGQQALRLLDEVREIMLRSRAEALAQQSPVRRRSSNGVDPGLPGRSPLMTR